MQIYDLFKENKNEILYDLKIKNWIGRTQKSNFH